MKVITEKGDFYVSWKYKHTLSPKGRWTIKTYCNLFLDKEEVASISILKHHTDTHEKEKARKTSLALLLKTMYPDDKGMRRIFWNAYLNRPRYSSVTSTHAVL